jgi:2'-5' RNA ligase
VTNGVPPESAVLVPVPEAEPCVERHRFRHDSVALRGVPAHITVLYPFMPSTALTAAVTRAVREVLAPFPAFSFSLARLERFPEGALYLAPDPAEPFVRLTEAFADRFPAYPPYGGAHPDAIPHLTVAQTPDVPVAEVADIERHLPIRCRAHEAWLMAEDDDRQWQRHTAVSLDGGGRM